MTPHRKALTTKQKNEVLGRYDGRCAECGTKDGPFDFDHIYALGLGGNNDLSNFRPLCRGKDSCHAKKTLADVKAIAKGKRIRGLTGKGPKKTIQSRGFDKTKRKTMAGKVVPNTGRAKMA